MSLSPRYIDVSPRYIVVSSSMITGVVPSVGSDDPTVTIDAEKIIELSEHAQTIIRKGIHEPSITITKSMITGIHIPHYVMVVL